jgi:hypothetical protein
MYTSFPFCKSHQTLGATVLFLSLPDIRSLSGGKTAIKDEDGPLQLLVHSRLGASWNSVNITYSSLH